MKPVRIVQDQHIEWRRDGTLFLIPTDMKVFVIGTAVCRLVYQPGVAVEGEDDWLVSG